MKRYNNMGCIDSNRIGLSIPFFGSDQTAIVLENMQNQYGHPQSCDEAKVSLADLQNQNATTPRPPSRVQQRYLDAYAVVIPQLQKYIADNNCNALLTTSNVPTDLMNTGTDSNTPPTAAPAATNNSSLLLLAAAAGVGIYLYNKNKKGQRTKRK
jgi:hypothetical protein